MYVRATAKQVRYFRGLGDGGISTALDPNTPPTSPDTQITGDVADVTVTPPSSSGFGTFLVVAFIIWALWQHTE